VVRRPRRWTEASRFRSDTGLRPTTSRFLVSIPLHNAPNRKGCMRSDRSRRWSRSAVFPVMTSLSRAAGRTGRPARGTRKRQETSSTSSGRSSPSGPIELHPDRPDRRPAELCRAVDLPEGHADRPDASGRAVKAAPDYLCTIGGGVGAGGEMVRLTQTSPPCARF